MDLVADKCNRCGKIVVKGMVLTKDSFLYMCDLKPGESCRPSLQLKEYYGDEEHTYCLDCLLQTVLEWIEKMKQRGASDIPLNRIIFPKEHVSSPCPVCGR